MEGPKFDLSQTLVRHCSDLNHRLRTPMAKVFVMIKAINESEYYVRATTVSQVAVTAWDF